MKQLMACLCFGILLSGCATSPQQSQDDADCARHFTAMPNCGGACLALDLVELSLLGVCDGSAYLMNLTRDAGSNIHDGVYRPRDGRFSVAVPGTGMTVSDYSAQQLIHGDDEYVFFLPSIASNPVYSAGVRSYLPEPDASMSLEEYSRFAVAEAKSKTITDSMDFRPLRGPLQVQLDGRPALLQVYAGLDEDSIPEDYLLVYVSKDAHSAEFLSIASRGSCPHCASGSEAEMLADMPEADSYVKSFHLAGAPAP